MEDLLEPASEPARLPAAPELEAGRDIGGPVNRRYGSEAKSYINKKCTEIAQKKRENRERERGERQAEERERNCKRRDDRVGDNKPIYIRQNISTHRLCQRSYFLGTASATKTTSGGGRSSTAQ